MHSINIYIVVHTPPQYCYTPWYIHTYVHTYVCMYRAIVYSLTTICGPLSSLLHTVRITSITSTLHYCKFMNFTQCMYYSRMYKLHLPTLTSLQICSCHNNLIPQSHTVIYDNIHIDGRPFMERWHGNISALGCSTTVLNTMVWE